MNAQNTPLPVAITIGQLTQGGSERQLYYFLSNCDRARWAPRVFVSGELGFWQGPIGELGIPITLLQGSQIAKLRQLRDACAAEGIKHFFSWSSYTNGYGLALRGLGVRRVGSFRNNLFADLPERRRRLWVWLSLAGITTAVCNSRSTYEALRRRLGARKAVEFVPNSVERLADPQASRAHWRKRLGVGDGETLVVGVGRLTAQKNFGRFIETIALASRATPLRAVVAGDGPDCREALERQRDAAGLAPETMRFIGTVADARELICAADIFLLTSDYEGTANVVLEAMAVGVPAVCTVSSNAGDLIEDGREGFVVEPRAEALAQKVSLLAGDPALRERVGCAAAARIRQQFEPRPIADRLWSLLCE